MTNAAAAAPPVLVLMALLLVQLAQPAASQVCPAGRALSSRQTGFVKSAGQGVNESYLYLVFLQDVTGSSAGGGSGSLECGGNATLLSMQRVEAALWSVANFRSRYPSVLPGVTLGALILDTCHSSLLPAQLLGNLHTCETTFGAAGSLVEPRNTAGFVGVDAAAQAADAFAVANWAGKPSVTYELTSSRLNRGAYPLLARVSASELTELDALAKLLQSLGVAHVQLVHSPASVQSGRFTSLADAAQTRLSTAGGICTVNRVALDSAAAAAASVAAFPRTRPVLLLMTADEAASFASQMLAVMPASGTFTWLMTSELWRSVDQLLPGRENFFAGSVALAPGATATYADYLTYFRSVRPDTADHAAKNPWLATWWSNNFRCNLPGSSGTTYASTCNYAAQNLQSTAQADSSTARLVQSVDLVLHALEATRRAFCGGASAPAGLCDAFRSEANRYRIAYGNLYSVASLGYTDVALDAATGAAAKYVLAVQNYQKRYPGHAWTQVGAYQTGGSLSVTASAQAYGTDERNTTWTGSGGACTDSACLARCPSNATATPTTGSVSASTAASESASGTTTGLDLSQMRYRRQYWVYALIVCASVGIIVTLLFMFYILFKLLGLPSELKSFNTLWSGQFLLFIILIGYVFLFAWIPWPGTESCGIIRFMLGFEYAAVFAILMVKLLNLMNDQLKPVYQVLLFLLGLGVQVAINIEWLILVPIEVTLTAVGTRCGQSFEQHLQSLVYCMLLILLCTCLAVRAHSIGRNNREAIFVGCTAGVSIPIWIAWGLVGSLNQDPDVKDASQAFGLFVNLTLVLLVIFLPKIHQLRRLEDSSDAKEVVAVDVLDDDVYDLEDPYYGAGKDPIYVLTTQGVGGDGPPSVMVSEPGGGGQFYLAAASPQDMLGLPSFANHYHGGPRSLQGGGVGGFGGGPRSIILGGGRTHRKAYSDYNPTGDDMDGRRPVSAPGSRRGAEGPSAATAAKAATTKTDRLAKLGFL